MANPLKKAKIIFYNLGFFARTLKGVGYFIRHSQASFKILIMQILFTFVYAMGISTLLAIAIGAAVNIIGVPVLTMINQQQLMYSLLIIIVTRELGPLLTAFIVIARSATAIATEIAGMVISHEVEAYISIGVDPIEHLAVPRFLGVTISLVLLNIYFSIFGLGGSYLVAQLFTSTPMDYYFTNLLQHLHIRDIMLSITKSIAFGAIISIGAVIQGFSVERASTEVPVAGLRAVSGAFALCILVNVLLSALYYVVLA
ncbi:MAG: ABC transporter permease [Treponema sp.]|jgi:phospholipid/cholesterol/gamma-HCH transport system permease protein|nr:ABC transporter permease [Treponema sp.]